MCIKIENSTEKIWKTYKLGNNLLINYFLLSIT